MERGVPQRSAQGRTCPGQQSAAPALAQKPLYPQSCKEGRKRAELCKPQGLNRNQAQKRSRARSRSSPPLRSHVQGSAVLIYASHYAPPASVLEKGKRLFFSACTTLTAQGVEGDGR